MHLFDISMVLLVQFRRRTSMWCVVPPRPWRRYTGNGVTLKHVESWWNIRRSVVSCDICDTVYCVALLCHTKTKKLWWSNRIAIIFCHVLMILSYSVSARNCLSGFDQRHWSTSGVRLRVAWADCSGAAKGLAAAKAGPWNIWHDMAPTKVNKRVIESRVGDGQW